MPAGWVVLVVALWIAVIALAAIVLTLVRRVSSLTGAGERSSLGPSVGTVLDDPMGDGGGWVGRLYLFLATGCQPCHVLLGKLCEADWGVFRDAAVEVVVVADAALDATGIGRCRRVVSEPVETRRRFGVRATPYAVVTDPTGRVRAGGVPSEVAGIVEMIGALGPSPAGWGG